MRVSRLRVFVEPGRGSFCGCRLTFVMNIPFGARNSVASLHASRISAAWAYDCGPEGAREAWDWWSLLQTRGCESKHRRLRASRAQAPPTLGAPSQTTTSKRASFVGSVCEMG